MRAAGRLLPTSLYCGQLDASVKKRAAHNWAEVGAGLTGRNPECACPSSAPPPQRFPTATQSRLKATQGCCEDVQLSGFDLLHRPWIDADQFREAFLGQFPTYSEPTNVASDLSKKGGLLRS